MKHAPGYPPSSRTFDWFMAVLGALVIAGVYQDGWAHNHGLVDQSFFTPWHAVLYGTMALNGLVLLGYGLLNLRRGYTFRNGLPYGYWLSAIGVALFLFGGLLDMAWHTLFGIEEDVSALLSPTHLLLALAAFFVLSGPMRSVARRTGTSAGPAWREMGPVLLTAGSMLSLLAFFTMYANPIGATDIAAIIGKSDRQPVVNNIYMMNADGSRQTRIVNTASADLWGASASPDGKWIVYRSAPGGGATAELYVAHPDGSGAHAITHDGRWATQPAWSPDGKRIAYVSVPAKTSGTYRLVTIDPSGARAKTLVNTVAEINGPTWSPDGAQIAYGTRNGLGTQIAIVPAGGGSPSWVAGTHDGSFPAWSPDGKMIAFTRSRGDASDVYAVQLSGGTPEEFAGDASMPAYSPSGDRLAYVIDHNGTADIGVATSDHSSAEVLTQLSGMQASRPAWTRDGRIVYSASANGSVYDTDIAQAFAEDAFLIQAVLFIGALLVLMRRFRLPFGSVTLIALIYAVEQATQHDHYFAIWSVAASAILADVAIAWYGEKLRDGLPLYAFAFGVPFMLTSLYLIADGVHHHGFGWPPNMSFGSPVLCGLAGLLIAFCVRSPLPAAQPAQTFVPPPSVHPQPVELSGING